MNQKFKYLGCAVILFVMLMALIPTASAGIKIYPCGTEQIYADEKIHHALVYDIDPVYFNNGYQPKIYGVNSVYLGVMKLLKQDHTNPQTWDFTPSSSQPGKMALMIPTSYCCIAGWEGIKNAKSLKKSDLTAAAAEKGIKNIYNNGKLFGFPIYINTNYWVKSS